MMVVKMMTVMMIDAPLPPPTDCQKTVSSVKALFLYTPSPPTKEASVRDPTVKHKVNDHSAPPDFDLCVVDCLFVYVHVNVCVTVKIHKSAALFESYPWQKYEKSQTKKDDFN